jgi:hypothetical protein
MDKSTQIKYKPFPKLNMESLTSDLQGITIIRIQNIRLWAKQPKRGDM